MGASYRTEPDTLDAIRADLEGLVVESTAPPASDASALACESRPRSTAYRPAPLPSPDALVPMLARPQRLTRAEATALLPQAARLDLRAAALAGTTGGRA